MKLENYRKKKKLSYTELGKLLNWSRSKAFQHCDTNPPCIKLIDAHRIVRITKGEVGFEDLLNGDC